MRNSYIEQMASIAFPYCLKRRKSGNYILLNRMYKPIGFNLEDGQYIHYRDYPIELAFARKLQLSTIRKLSWKNSGERDIIHLYGSCPTWSKTETNLYFERLKVLFNLKLKRTSIYNEFNDPSIDMSEIYYE